MKKIVVTGGAGFIGSHTAVELYNSGYVPIVIDNFVNSEKDVIQGIEKIIQDKVKVYEGDCCDESFVDSIFKIEQPEGVIHFAAYKAVGESVEKPLKYYHNNLQSLVVLLKMMEKYECGSLVFSSSCTVYGQPDTLPVTEEAPAQHAESPYGNTKQISEEIIEDYAKSKRGFRAISLRYFNPIGAHPSSLIGELPLGVPNNLVPYITQTAIGIRDQLTVFGGDYDTEDGSCLRDFIHVVDLAKAHVSALEYLNSENCADSYSTFNIGTGAGHSVLEVIATFEKVTGVKLNYNIGPRREGDIEKVYADVSKANEILNWRSELSLEESLKDAWSWQVKISEDGK